jgi:hypothetical protein
MEVKNRLMTPDHPKWNEFLYRVFDGRTQAEVKRDESDGIDKSEEMPRCNGPLKNADGTLNRKSYAVRALKTMGMDVKSSVEFFEKHGGYCDCEILFNVEESYDNKCD